MKIVEHSGFVYIRNWGKWYIGKVGSKKLERLKIVESGDLLDWALDSLMEGGKSEKRRKTQPVFNTDTALLDDSFLDDNDKPSKSGYKTKRNK